MLKVFTAVKVSPMGELDPKFGQTYWGSVHEQAMPVMFNLMAPRNIGEGAKIQAEDHEIKESAKGTQYMRLKKVKVEGGAEVQLPLKDTKQELLELTYENTVEILKILKASEIPVIEDEPEDVFPN